MTRLPTRYPGWRYLWGGRTALLNPQMWEAERPQEAPLTAAFAWAWAVT